MSCVIYFCNKFGKYGWLGRMNGVLCTSTTHSLGLEEAGMVGNLHWNLSATGQAELQTRK